MSIERRIPRREHITLKDGVKVDVVRRGSDGKPTRYVASVKTERVKTASVDDTVRGAVGRVRKILQQH